MCVTATENWFYFLLSMTRACTAAAAAVGRGERASARAREAASAAEEFGAERSGERE